MPLTPAISRLPASRTLWFLALAAAAFWLLLRGKRESISLLRVPRTVSPTPWEGGVGKCQRLRVWTRSCNLHVNLAPQPLGSRMYFWALVGLVGLVGRVGRAGIALGLVVAEVVLWRRQVLACAGGGVVRVAVVHGGEENHSRLGGCGGGMGGGGMPMMPMSPQAQASRDRDRERNTWLSEDESVWGTTNADGNGVVGLGEEREPVQPTHVPAGVAAGRAPVASRRAESGASEEAAVAQQKGA